MSYLFRHQIRMQAVVPKYPLSIPLAPERTRLPSTSPTTATIMPECFLADIAATATTEAMALQLTAALSTVAATSAVTFTVTVFTTTTWSLQ